MNLARARRSDATALMYPLQIEYQFVSLILLMKIDDAEIVACRYCVVNCHSATFYRVRSRACAKIYLASANPAQSLHE